MQTVICKKQIMLLQAINAAFTFFHLPQPSKTTSSCTSLLVLSLKNSTYSRVWTWADWRLLLALFLGKQDTPQSIIALLPSELGSDWQSDTERPTLTPRNIKLSLIPPPPQLSQDWSYPALLTHKEMCHHY